ncbi:hypothetical protein MTO96_020088 [Rhipicephalus appendiculatus]
MRRRRCLAMLWAAALALIITSARAMPTAMTAEAFPGEASTEAVSSSDDAFTTEGQIPYDGSHYGGFHYGVTEGTEADQDTKQTDEGQRCHRHRPEPTTPDDEVPSRLSAASSSSDPPSSSKAELEDYPTGDGSRSHTDLSISPSVSVPSVTETGTAATYQDVVSEDAISPSPYSTTAPPKEMPEQSGTAGEGKIVQETGMAPMAEVTSEKSHIQLPTRKEDLASENVKVDTANGDSQQKPGVSYGDLKDEPTGSASTDKRENPSVTVSARDEQGDAVSSGRAKNPFRKRVNQASRKFPEFQTFLQRETARRLSQNLREQNSRGVPVSNPVGELNLQISQQKCPEVQTLLQRETAKRVSQNLQEQNSQRLAAVNPVGELSFQISQQKRPEVQTLLQRETARRVSQNLQEQNSRRLAARETAKLVSQNLQEQNSRRLAGVNPAGELSLQISQQKCPEVQTLLQRETAELVSQNLQEQNSRRLAAVNPAGELSLQISRRRHPEAQTFQWAETTKLVSRSLPRAEQNKAQAPSKASGSPEAPRSEQQNPPAVVMPMTNKDGEGRSESEPESPRPDVPKIAAPSSAGKDGTEAKGGKAPETVVIVEDKKEGKEEAKKPGPTKTVETTESETHISIDDSPEKKPADVVVQEGKPHGAKKDKGEETVLVVKNVTVEVVPEADVPDSKPGKVIPAVPPKETVVYPPPQTVNYPNPPYQQPPIYQPYQPYQAPPLSSPE